MTKTTREIEAEKNKNIMWLGVILSVGIMLVIMILYVEYRLQDVPVQICHNETNFDNWNNCIGTCFNNTLGKLSPLCSTLIKGDCDRIRAEYSIEKIDYEKCAMPCFDLPTETKEICEFKLKDKKE